MMNPSLALRANSLGAPAKSIKCFASGIVRIDLSEQGRSAGDSGVNRMSFLDG